MAELQGLDEIELEYFNRAIIHHGIFLFHPSEAIAVIGRCRELKRPVFGINAFLLLDKGKIQPNRGESVDYSQGDHSSEFLDGGYWSAAIQHIKNRSNADFFFEVVYGRKFPR